MSHPSESKYMDTGGAGGALDRLQNNPKLYKHARPSR